MTSAIEPRRHRIPATLVSTLCMLAFSSLAFGQQEASIIGQVKDESGAILPGVTVSATSPALQVPEVTDVTNQQGEYRLTPLPIGTYAVVYTIQGFQTVRREEIRLTAGFTARLDVTAKDLDNRETVGQSEVQFFFSDSGLARVTGNHTNQRRVQGLAVGSLDCWAVQDGVTSNTITLTFVP